MRRLILTGLLLLLPVMLAAQPADPDPEPHRWLTHSAIAAMMALQGADVATTMYCRGARQCEEANPLLRPVQDRPAVFGAVKLAVASAVGFAIIRLHYTKPKTALAMAAAFIVISAVVVTHNVRAMREIR